MRLVKADRFLRALHHRAEDINRPAQIVLALANRLKLFLYCQSLLVVLLESVNLSAADTVFQEFVELIVYYSRQASKFIADLLCLTNYRLKYSIFWTLFVNEVVAKDFGLWLQLAVNSTVPLLHSTRIPWNVEMEEVIAMCLEV